MRIFRYSQPDFDARIAALDRASEPEPAVEKTVAQILAAVRAEGDKALVRYTAKFGGPNLDAARIPVTRQEMDDALRSMPPPLKRALRLAHSNVRAFARRSLRKNWSTKNAQGATVGERFDPFGRVGIYIPGGTAPLVSSAIMTVTLAAVAGVPEIVVATPAGPDGTIHPALLAALSLAGATEVYRVGGAQAIAALAFGTATIRPVVKIFGPGNAYVVEAKRQVFGKVAIDLLPGPSEILVIADSSANPAWIAADLLAQAEHGKGSLAVLLTDSDAIVRGVEKEIAAQLATLSRSSHLLPVLDSGTWLIRVRNLQQAVDIANGFAPEHLSLVARKEKSLAAQIRTSGAIFLGAHSPVAAGDFAAGPSHELPTGGAGKSFAGLTVDQFQRRTSVVRFTPVAIRRTAPIVSAFAAAEGLDAHARSATIRANPSAK